MKDNLTCALLISTYNWPQALNLVLKSVEKQSVIPDEVLIADDGSGEDTKQLVDRYQLNGTLHIKHFWQEDQGFRKAQILNKAIAASTADYIIQVDGDCILHPHHVKDHLSHAEPGVYLYGSRVNMQEKHLSLLFKNNQIDFTPFSKGIKKRTRAIYAPALSNNYKPAPGVHRKMRGCNVSYWRKDILKVNGYDERYTGWGREDSELAWRIANTGVQGKRLRYAGIVYHIWHAEKSKNNLQRNDAMEQQTIDSKSIWTDYGIDKYLNATENENN